MNELMADRSVDIIMISKRFALEACETVIAEYMSKTCACPIEVYDHKAILRIVKHAFMDFIFYACRTSRMVVLHWLIDNYGHKDDLSNILRALSHAQVMEVNKDGIYEYINGFHETDFMKELDNEDDKEDSDE